MKAISSMCGTGMPFLAVICAMGMMFSCGCETGTSGDEASEKETSAASTSDLPGEQSEADGDSGFSFRIEIPKATLKGVQADFIKHTGFTWPDGAEDVKFADSHGGFFGDGVLYLVMKVSPKLVEQWLASPPPWKEEGGWETGPIPPDVGMHTGFTSERPRGTSQAPGKPKEYSGGSPEILAVLQSREIRYVARNRNASPPWYNGDLLILDPQTGIVRYSRWDN